MMSYVKFLVSKRGLFCNYSMLAPYSIVFTAHSSLQKRAMHTKKSVCIVTTIAHYKFGAHYNF